MKLYGYTTVFRYVFENENIDYFYYFCSDEYMPSDKEVDETKKNAAEAKMKNLEADKNIAESKNPAHVGARYQLVAPFRQKVQRYRRPADAGRRCGKATAKTRRQPPQRFIFYA